MDAGRYFEEGFEDFLSDIIEHGVLCDEPVMEGVARFCKDNGYDNLSEKQQKVIDAMMHKYFNDGVCEKCGCPISWCEMENSLENGHLCAYCQHTWESIEKD